MPVTAWNAHSLQSPTAANRLTECTLSST